MENLLANSKMGRDVKNPYMGAINPNSSNQHSRKSSKEASSQQNLSKLSLMENKSQFTDKT